MKDRAAVVDDCNMAVHVVKTGTNFLQESILDLNDISNL